VIGRIVGWSLRSRGVVVVLAAALLVFGATQLRDLPVDVLPEFTPPRVEVQTEDLGLSAARVQFPLEYHAEVLGDQADQRAAERRVLGVAAIALALVPLAVRGAIPGHEIVQPMALVVLGSLVTAPCSTCSSPRPLPEVGSTSERRLDAAQ
jgi:Cu/Ag efflux pump CusA